MNHRSLPFHVFLLLVASVWVVFDQRGVINIDGVLYLRQANLFALGNIEAAKALYPWPFYGYFIAVVHKLTGVSLHYSAQVINVSAFVIAAYFFLKSLVLISSERSVLLAGFLTLVTSIPLLDDYVPMLLRDNGMWAGFTAGLYFYLRWHQSPTFTHALLSQLSFTLGALFRPELIIFNGLLPLASLFIRPAGLSRLGAAMMMGLLGILALCAGLAYLGFLYMNDGLSTLNMGRLAELLERPRSVIENLLAPLPMSITTSYHFLHVMVDDHALALKYIFITYIVAYKWVAVVGLLHLSAAYLAVKHRLVDFKFMKPLVIVFGVSFAITAINLPVSYVLSRRYWVMNLWVVYLFSALGFCFVIRQLWHGAWLHLRWARLGFVAVVLGFALVVLFDSHRENDDLQTAAWIQSNGLELDRTYIEDARLCFYLGRYECGPADLGGRLVRVILTWSCTLIDTRRRLISRVMDSSKNFRMIAGPALWSTRSNRTG
jgi:hypothetical protein